MCRTIGTVDGRRHPDARTRGQHHTLAVPHETHDVAMGVPPPPCRCERALCCRRLYARPRPRFALSRSSRGNWPRSAQMLRVGSVVPGACAVAILWRLYGDEDGPLRTSPNLSLRYSHGPDGRWTSWRAPCWLLAEKLSPAPDRGSGSCARCALTATTQRAILVPKATECSSTWSRRLSRPGPARETQFSRAL